MSLSSSDRRAPQKSSIWGALSFAGKKRPSVTISARELPDSETSSTTSIVKDTVPEVETHAQGCRLAILMAVMIMAAFMVGLDGSIMATAVPHITSIFDSLDQAGWYGSSYLLAMAALQPMCGRVYVDFNVKGAFLCGILVFELGSSLCAAATSSVMLIIGRSVAGGGASLLFNGAFTIIGKSVPLEKRALYIAILSSVFGLTSIIGPLLGGVIVDHLSWRWCFWLNLPIGGVAAPALILSFRNPARSEPTLPWVRRLIRLYLPSTLLLSGGLVSLCTALQNGGSAEPWKSSQVWGFFLASGLLLAAFLFVQMVICKDGFFPRSILVNRMASTSAIFSLLFSMALNSHTFFLPYYFQAVQGVSAQTSGVRTVPYLLASSISAVIIGSATNKTGKFTPFLWLGSCCFCVGAALFATLRVNSSTSQYIGYQILAGAGAGACSHIPFVAVQFALPVDQIPIGNALVLFCNTIGGAIVVSLAQCLFFNVLVQEIPRKTGIADPKAVLAAGAAGWRNIVPQADTVGVQSSYMLAVRSVFFLALIAGGLAFMVSLLLPNNSIKQEKASVVKDVEEAESKSGGSQIDSEPAALLRLASLRRTFSTSSMRRCVLAAGEMTNCPAPLPILHESFVLSTTV